MDVTAVGDPAVVAELIKRVEARKVANEPEPLPPIPAPEVTCRPASDLELAGCAGARGLLKRFEPGVAAATYARGPYIDATGTKVLDIVDSLMVRAGREGWACWVKRDQKWEYDCGWLLLPVRRMAANDWARWLAGSPEHDHRCDIVEERCARRAYDVVEHGKNETEGCYCGHPDAKQCRLARKKEKAA